VLTDDEDAILDAVGEYAARRKPVRDALPADAPTGADASGRAREVLSQAVRDYALVGDVETVTARVSRDSKPRGRHRRRLPGPRARPGALLMAVVE